MATILTVHGTGASGPEHGEHWWQKDSPFEKHLRELIESENGELIYEPMIWDGANSETSRRAAGGRLAQKCEELEQSNESYCVIGHSHGGSVITAGLFIAASRGQELPHLRKWITVGTPFLQAKKRRFLFNRINFWEKTVYVLVLTSCLLFSIAILSMPPFRHFVVGFDIQKLRYLLNVFLVFLFLFSPAALVMLFMGVRSSRDCYSGRKRLADRFDRYFARRWNSFFHPDDEAITGLCLAGKVKFPIFRGFFLLPQISLLVLILVPIALGFLATSQQSMLGLFEFFNRQAPGQWPDWMIENGQLRGQGKDIPTNALLIFLVPLFLAFKSGLGASIQEAFPLLMHTNVFFAMFIFIIFFAFVFYIPALILVLTTSSIGALASLSLSKILDWLTWHQLRASAFGDDHRVEAIIRTATQPMWLTAEKAALPKPLSEEISAYSDFQAAQSIARFRSALNILAFANGGLEKSDMLSRYLTWDELIHTSYFKVPRFRKLIAYAIVTATGFRATEQFQRDPDYAVVKGWFEGLQPSDKTEVLVPAGVQEWVP